MQLTHGYIKMQLDVEYSAPVIALINFENPERTPTIHMYGPVTDIRAFFQDRMTHKKQNCEAQ